MICWRSLSPSNVEFYYVAQMLTPTMFPLRLPSVGIESGTTMHIPIFHYLCINVPGPPDQAY